MMLCLVMDYMLLHIQTLEASLKAIFHLHLVRNHVKPKWPMNVLIQEFLLRTIAKINTTNVLSLSLWKDTSM